MRKEAHLLPAARLAEGPAPAHTHPMAGETISTRDKALQINIDASRYGTFAEIGAGQEVARWFFHVGGAAGTVAKTISAYDMAVSDAIYGQTRRYVSRQRLQAMLDYEWRLMIERLQEERGASTMLFVFADTVTARSYSRQEEGDGWLGIRFQTERRGPASEIVIHARMWDLENARQQEALGILGVNLVHGAYHECQAPAALLTALLSGLSLERIELDAIELTGPAFPGIDPRRVAVQAVRDGYANAIVLPTEGPIVPPTESLRKRPILLERGLFRTVKPVYGTMLAAARTRFQQEFPGAEREPLSLFEISLLPARREETPTDDEVIQRTDELLKLGAPVAITRYTRSYRLTEHLRRYTAEPLRFVMGLPAVLELLEASYYDGMVGGALEAMGKLLAENVKLYVYPVDASRLPDLLRRSRLDPAQLSYPAWGDVTADNIRLAPPAGHLYDYLRESGWLVPLSRLPAG